MDLFTKRLKELRKNKGLSFQDLADILFERFDFTIWKSLISKYEKGQHKSSFNFINFASAYFGVTMDYLSGRSDSKYGDRMTPKQTPILGCIAAGSPMCNRKSIDGYELAQPHCHYINIKNFFKSY